ncbi:MAG: preprotein translocase subunit SecG [Pseudomonadota bacterium]
MESLIIVIHIVSAVAITGLVLIQQGKGADMGASFGSGASQTIFGSAGTGNVLTKSTTWLAILFFMTSLALAVVAKNRAAAGIEVESLLADPDAAAVVTPAPTTQLPDLDATAEVPADQAVTDVPATPADAVPAETSEPAVDVPAVDTNAPATVEPAAETTEN